MARKIDESLQFPQPLSGAPQAQTLPPGQIPKKMAPQLRWPDPTTAPDPVAAAAPPAAPPAAAPAAAPAVAPAAAPAVPPEVKSGGWFKRPFQAAGNAATAVGGVAKTVGGAAAGVANAAIPSMVGYGAAGAVNSLRQKELDSAPAFVAPETQPGQIPGAAPGQVAPRAEAGSFLNQSELGRNLGNAVMALPGGSGAVNAIQAGLRIAPVVGRAATAASVASKAAPIVPAVAQGFAGGDIANPGKSALPPPSAPASPAAPFSDARDGPAIPTPKFVQKDGTILRDGNSYSGKNVQVDADIVNKDGSLRSPGGGFVSTGSSEGFRQDQLELQRNAAERAAMPVGGTTGIGSRGTSMMDDLVAKHNASKGPDMSGLSPYDRAQMQASLRQSQDANVNAMAIAGMNNSTAQAGLANSANIAAMHDATQRRSNDQNNATSLRAQDMSLAGHMAPLQYQQARMQLAGKYMQAANGDPAKAQALAMSDGAHDVADHFSKNVEALQGQAGKADSLIENKRKEIVTGIKGAFNHMDKEGQPKVSEALEQKAVARFMRTNPDFHKEGDPAKRQKMIDDALGDEEIMSRLEKPTEGGWGSVTPNIVSKPMLRQDNIPDAELLQGQMGAPIGALRNLLSPNTNKGDRFYDPGDGRTAVNMGDMSARALKRFQEHQEAAKNKLRPN